MISKFFASILTLTALRKTNNIISNITGDIIISESGCIIRQGNEDTEEIRRGFKV